MKNLLTLRTNPFMLSEGVMSEIDIMAKEARNVKEFIKEFMAEFGDKVKDNAETKKWLESMYKDTVNEKSQGLWANIHAKRKKGEKPARKGSKAYKKAKKAADQINNEDEELDEAVISLPGFVLLAIGAALATRIGFMSDEKLQRGIDITKATAKAIVKELPIIGNKIKKKEFDQSQADDIQKYLKDELSDQDIVDILMKNPDIKQSIINLSNGDGTYRYYYNTIKKLGGAKEYGRAHKKFKALRKKLADGEIEVKESVEIDSGLNESERPRFKKRDRIEYKLTHQGGVGQYANAISKSDNVETGVIAKRTRSLAGFKYMLTTGLELSDHEILGLAESVTEKTSVKKGDYVLYKGNGTKWVKSEVMQVIPSANKLHIDWNDEYTEVHVKEIKPVKESVTEASRWKGKEIYPNYVKPSDIGGFVKKESDLEVGKTYVFFEPGMNAWQAEWTYNGSVGKGAAFGHKFTSNVQFVDHKEEYFSKEDIEDMIKTKELAVMESESVNEGGMDELDALAQDSKDLESFKKEALKEFPKFKGNKGTDEWLEDIYNMANESVNEGLTQKQIDDVEDSSNIDIAYKKAIKILKSLGHGKSIKDIEKSGNIDIAYKKAMNLLKSLMKESVNETASPYELSAEAFTAELEKANFISPNIEVSVGPSRWGKPGELRFRDHVTLRTVGNTMELYIIPLGGDNDYELYTDKSYKTGRELKRGDAKTIIRAMKRYVNQMNESVVNEGKDKVDVASLSIGNTYKDKKGYPVKVIDIKGTGSRWKITYQYEDGKEKTVSTSLDKGINLYESLVEAKEISRSKIDIMGSKILGKIKIGTTFVTDGGDYTVTGFGPKSNAFQEFDAEKDGKPCKVKLTAMYGVKLEVTDDPRSRVYRKEEMLNSMIFESLDEGKMPDKYIGNDEIVYLKTKEDSRGAHYNLYYKGHDIDTGGRNFRNEMDLIDFADDYILSNQLYNKLKYTKAKPLPESVVNEKKLDHKVHAIEDSILQGVAEWVGTTKSKLFNILRYDKRAAKDLADLSKHLKPILDNWDEYGKVEEKLTQTFGDYLKDLDVRFKDGHKAAMGDNGGEPLENRQTALHNLRLFGNYIQSLLKEYGKDKTKLTFMNESVNEGKVKVPKTIKKESDLEKYFYGLDLKKAKEIWGKSFGYHLTATDDKSYFVSFDGKKRVIKLTDLKESVNEAHLGDKLYPENAEEADGKAITKLLEPYKSKWVTASTMMDRRDFDAGLREYIMDFEPEAIKNKKDLVEDFADYLSAMGYTDTLSVQESKHVMTLESFLNEELPTQEIDPNKFQNPYKKDRDFFKQGFKDDSVMDDAVETKPVNIPANRLKPSQDAVYLGKALGMAIGGVEGGNLEAVISQDNRILDGHHRWAATIFNNPKAKVGGIQAQLRIGDLVPVLRQAGDALGNERGLPPKGGDQNIFKATLKDVRDAIYLGKYMNPEFYNKDKATQWYEEKGEDEVMKSLNLLQKVAPPAGAPPRADMPKIKPEQVKALAKKLQGGAIDVRAPYVGDSSNKKKAGLSNYLQKESLNNMESIESFIGKKQEVIQKEEAEKNRVESKRIKSLTEFSEDWGVVKEEEAFESRFKRGRWTQISPTADKELDDHFYDLINIAYAEIGGHVKIKKPEDVFADKDWTFWQGVDLHGSPDLDLIIWGKNTKYGVKFAGVGHDGERDSRKEYLTHKGKDLKKLGYYGEVSGKLAEILLIKYGVPVVRDEAEVEAAIGGKNIEWHGTHPTDNTIPGDGWYTRTIGGSKHTKILVGRPK